MKVLACEGIVDNGLIRPVEGVQLPEKARVYVIVPELEPKRVAHVYSPPARASGAGQGFRQGSD